MALNTDPTRPGWSPDLVAVAAVEAVPDALVLSTSTVSGKVEGDAPSVRVIHVDDADAGFSAEGADITPSDPTLAETVVYTGKIAQLVKVSREQHAQHRAAELLSTSVQRAVVKAANVAYLAQQAPGGGATTPPAGLLNQSPTDGGTLDSTLDALVDAVAHIEGAGGLASHIIIDPYGWAEIAKLKTDSGSNVPLLGAGTEATERRLLGLPVIVTPAMPTGQMLVLDRSAVVSAVGDVLVATSDHTYFASDSVALRVTWRFGAKVVDQDRLVTLDVEVDSSSEESSGS